LRLVAKRVGLVCVAALVLLVAYGFFYERQRLTVTHVNIPVRGWSPEIGRLRLVHFSDLHFEGIGTRERQLRQLLSDIKPDIIVVTGDLFNSAEPLLQPDRVQETLEYLRTLPFSQRFFVVLGEEEYPFREHLRKEMAKVRIELLDDELMQVPVGTSGLNVVGLTEDTRTLDSYYCSAKGFRANVERFRRFNRLPELAPFRGYRFYLAGQYSLKWQNYAVTGTVPPGEGPFELAVYSQFPAAYLAGYFFHVNVPARTASLTSSAAPIHGTTIANVQIDSVTEWLFRVVATTLKDRTKIQARVWRAGDREPGEWTLEAEDRQLSRASSGSVGIRMGTSAPRRGGTVKVTMINRGQTDDVFAEGVEGVRETVVDDAFERVTRPDRSWMTLEDVTEFVSGRHRCEKPRMLEAKLDRLLEGREPSMPTILLTHRPVVIRVAVNKKIDLLAAGHTQGGQIRMPPLVDDAIGRFVFARQDGEYLDRGLKTFADTHLYINRGLGTTDVPLRIGTPPEITVYQLTAR
jgi:predicted MPP superfamily phosphohydrolase